jgi:hypothetical protein
MTSRLDSSTATRGAGTTGIPSLFFESERWPDEVHIALALMDRPIERDPAAHVFFDSRVPWIVLGDGLQRRGGPSGVEPVDSD